MTSVVPMLALATSRNQFGGRNRRLLTVKSESGVGVRDLSEGRAPGQDLDSYRTVKSGDLVVNKLWARFGAYGVSGDEGVISPAYWVLRLDAAQVVPRYLHYLLRSEPYKAEIGRISKNMPPNGFELSWDQFRRLRVPLESLTQQCAIADFLDSETARIDDILRLRSRQRELVSQHQASEVDETVSLGSPTAVRRITSFITSGPRGWSDLIADDGDRPFIRSADLQRHSIRLRTTSVTRVRDPHTAESRRTQLRAGDVCIGITGANTGWVGLYNGDLGIASVSQHVALMRPHLVNPAWLAYSASSTAAQQQLMAGQYGGTKQQLGLEDLRQLVIRLPGESEQHSGVARLERSRLFVERVASVICRQIASLREHRQALITAAISGEIDVSTASGRGEPA